MKKLSYFYVLILLFLFSSQISASIPETDFVLNPNASIVYDTGFMKPGDTLLNNWDNTSVNPLGDADGSIATTFDTTNNYLIGIDYNFNIPSQAQIVGFEVEFAHAPTGSAPWADLDVELMWDSRNSETTTGFVDIIQGEYEAPNYKVTTFGSQNELWSRSWDVNDLSNSNFGLKFSLQFLAGGEEQVSYAFVKVYYTLSYADITVTSTDNLTLDNSTLETFTLDWSVTFDTSTDYRTMAKGVFFVNAKAFTLNASGSSFDITNNSMVTLNSDSQIYAFQNGSISADPIFVNNNFTELLEVNGTFVVTLETSLSRMDNTGTLFLEKSIVITVSLSQRNGGQNSDTNPTSNSNSNSATESSNPSESNSQPPDNSNSSEDGPGVPLNFPFSIIGTLLIGFCLVFIQRRIMTSNN